MCGPPAPHLGLETTEYPDWKTSPKHSGADDITIFVTMPTDIPIISDAIQCYKKATGAGLNTRKSMALAVGGWSTSTDRLKIPYHAEIKILGVNFAITIEYSMNKCWANVTGKVRAKVRDTY